MTEPYPIGSCAIGRTKVLTDDGVTDLVLLIAETSQDTSLRFVIPSRGARLLAFALMEMADEIDAGKV